MNPEASEILPRFMHTLGLEEPPMGIFYTDERPAEGISPKPGDLPTREKEMRNAIDWETLFGHFSCVIGNAWRARKKGVPAFFDAEHFGCPGGAFWLGFMKPQSETIIHYVSSGVPGRMKGELYCESPDTLRRIFTEIDPPVAPKKYCVIKALPLFQDTETPDVVAFFARPETLSGLHQLAAFVTNDIQVVTSPWGAGCTGLVTWPFKYLAEGKNKAVLGGWDPSARKFYKTDELTFTVPFGMFQDMLQHFETSFLTTPTWEIVRKKIARSKRAWGEEALTSQGQGSGV
ncbi:MAG: DUF169 domain-containing protein [Deltaproteobacteria bacterium]|nr:DUF169 domain-containing protein [Deltaproteobacteria bacterium]